MKTILIAIQNRPQARNVLRTDILTTLIRDQRVRIVVLVPDYKQTEYQKEFGAANLLFEGVADYPHGQFRPDRWFDRLALFYIDSPTGRFLRRQWLLWERRQPVRYFISFLAALIIGHSRILRKIFRFLDYLTIAEPYFNQFFERYQPSLVFCPNIVSKFDQALIRQAKQRKVFSVGMINAWDNITLAKYPFRLLPDKLVVYNSTLKAEAVKYLDMKSEDIYITGWPHFDFYLTSTRSPREDFCRGLKIDPRSRILLFASIGSALNPTEWQVLKLLDQAMADAKLPQDLVIIFRQHPTEKTAIDQSQYSRRVIFDDSKTTIASHTRSYPEILRADMQHLADSIYHAVVTLNTASTMSIDAAMFDKPIVNIAFDGWEDRPFYQSVRRFYAPSHDHYQYIIKTGGVRIAHSFNELLDAVLGYLQNPDLDSVGRARIVKEQCGQVDGQAGRRVATHLLELLV